MEPGGLIILVALFALFWLFIIRPQRRRLQAQRELHALGGLLGHVRRVNDDDDTLELEIAPGTTVRVVRHGIAAVIPPEKAHEEFIRNEREPS